MSSNMPANRPCYYHGHEFLLFSDGSEECARCGLYYGPDPRQVNALLTLAAGRKTYDAETRRLSRAALALSLPKAPPPAVPKSVPRLLPPPVVASGYRIDVWTVLPIAAFFVGAAAFGLGALVRLAQEALR